MSKNDWEPADDFVLEDAAMNAVKAERNGKEINCFVIAGPGAGKTELLAQRACYLLQTDTCRNPRKILAISFKKDASRNLLERVKRRCGKELARRFVSQTYDAFAKGLLDHFRMALQEKYRPEANYDVILNPRNILEIYKHLDEKIVHIRNNPVLIDGLTNKSVRKSHPFLQDYIERVWVICLKGKLGFPPQLTFQMITYLASYIIHSNPKIKKALNATYSHVFLDEFQDTTKLQYSLVRECFYQTNTVITAVGDIKQRIMVWAGADKDVFNKYASDFQAQKFELIMNHRSAPGLIQIQRVFSCYLTGQNWCKIEASTKWGENDGTCEIWNFDNAQNEAKRVAMSIKIWMDEEKLEPRDICVLVRNRPDNYGTNLIEALYNNGIMARNENKYQDLLSEESVKVVLDILLCVFSKKARREWMDSIELMQNLKGVYTDEDSDASELCILENEFERALYEFKKEFDRVKSKNQLKKSTLNIFKFLGRDEFINYFPQYKRGAYFKKTIKDFVELLWEEYEEYNDWNEAFESIKGDHTIPIMTIHKSKGLEYDTVIFVGLEDGAFWNFRKNSEEDTCTFFVGLSRAKKRVIFTFCHVREVGYGSTQAKNNIGLLYDLLNKSNIVQEKNF